MKTHIADSDVYFGSKSVIAIFWILILFLPLDDPNDVHDTHRITQLKLCLIMFEFKLINKVFWNK